MIKDPELKWNGPFPYDVLAAAGLTPHSTMREVKDASFVLMARDAMTPEVRAAWDELRLTPRRLLADFFLYPTDLPAEADPAAGPDTGTALGPMKPAQES